MRNTSVLQDKGLQLVFTGNLSELSQLMSHPEHAPLRPLLLLLGWDRYPTAGSGKGLLDALWPSEVRESRKEPSPSLVMGSRIL